MGIDIMKGNGTRCPPILVAGLLVMCLYLMCSWWSLSSENSELLKQLDNLAEQLRINADELGKCSQERTLLDEKLKDSQNRFVQQQIKMEQVKESEDEVKESYQKAEVELQESKKKSESVEKNLELCQAEMVRLGFWNGTRNTPMESLKKLGESKDKATETLRTENESLKSEIEQKDKQIKELEKQFKTVDKPTDVLAKNKLMETLVKNFNANLKKNPPKTVNTKPEKEAKGFVEQQNEEKFETEGKNYGDSGLSLDNDPREAEMKDS